MNYGMIVNKGWTVQDERGEWESDEVDGKTRGMDVFISNQNSP